MTCTRLFHLITTYSRWCGITARNITIDILVPDRLRNSSSEKAAAEIFREDLNLSNDTWQTACADALLNNPTITPYYLSHGARSRTHYVFAQQPGQQAYTLSPTTLFRLHPSALHLIAISRLLSNVRGGATDGGLCINDARDDAFARTRERRLRKRRLLRSRWDHSVRDCLDKSLSENHPHLGNSDLSATTVNYAATL